FFDFRTTYGDQDLVQSLKAFIIENMDNQTPFLPFLAKDALQNPPPLSFFRQFVLEKPENITKNLM
ncbi:MAG: hypothetical protein AAF242_15330, partial [Bacteroidota bacterium]